MLFSFHIFVSVLLSRCYKTVPRPAGKWSFTGGLHLVPTSCASLTFMKTFIRAESVCWLSWSGEYTIFRHWHSKTFFFLYLSLMVWRFKYFSLFFCGETKFKFTDALNGLKNVLLFCHFFYINFLLENCVFTLSNQHWVTGFYFSHYSFILFIFLNTGKT